MKTSRRISGSKRRRVRGCVAIKKCAGAIVVLVSVTKSRQHSELLDRQPHQVGVKDMFFDLRYPAEVERTMVVALEGENRIGIQRIVIGTDDSRPAQIAVESRVGI